MSAPRPYTLSVLLHPDADSKTRASLESTVRSWVEERGGTIGQATHASARRLAYPIRHAESAANTTVLFQLAPQEMSDLRTKLGRETGVLRFAIYQQLPRTTGRKTLADVPLRTPAGPLPASAPKKEKVSLEKLDEKIAEILKEEVL